MHSDAMFQNLAYLSVDMMKGFGSPGFRAFSFARRSGVSSKMA
jgi:hypothetical protein